MKRKSKVACQCYAVAHWGIEYENNVTRKLKFLKWIPTPVNHDGLGYRVVISGKDGERILAAWYLILQVAARSPVRGVLASETMPYEPRHLAIMTGAKSATFTEALRVLSEPEIGWLIRVTWPLFEKDIKRNAAGVAWHTSGDSPDKPAESPDTSGDSPDRGKQGNRTTGTEQKGNKKGKPTNPVSDSYSIFSDSVSVSKDEKTAAMEKFRSHNYTGAEALRFAVTKNKNGKIAATDIQGAIETIPDPELLEIAAEIYAVRTKHSDKDVGYFVGVARKLIAKRQA